MADYPHPSRRPALSPDETKAREKLEREQKEYWSRQLYLEMQKISAPAVREIEPCVKTELMEKISDLPDDRCISNQQVLASVRDYLVEQLSKNSPPIRRAPRYPVVFVEPLEEYVEDERHSHGMRVVAWIKLLKLLGLDVSGRKTYIDIEGDEDFRPNETYSRAPLLCL